MRGNSLGKLLSLTSFGESHGPALGAVVDGVPGGLPFCLEHLEEDLKRRAPGRSPGTTPRREPDRPEVLSGIFEGKTLGTPIAVVVRNVDARPQDYKGLPPRAGHGDKTFLAKFGHRDPRGGGRSSGRETVARVIGGHFAGLVIPHIKVRGFLTQVGPMECSPEVLGYLEKEERDLYHWPCSEGRQGAIEDYLLSLQRAGQSTGARVSVVISHCPPGLGEPVFEKLKSDLARAFVSIGAVVGVRFGDDGPRGLKGIHGGISEGGPILVHILFRPTSTVGPRARQGRHDPCIAPRAVAVVEAMAKLVLADHALRQHAYQLEHHR